MRIAIIDDEANQRETLKEYVSQYFSKKQKSYECFLFERALDFVDSYNAHYDIILLDIDMPGMDGMTAAKKIREKDEHVAIIFITNMAQYAIKGYEVNATDFMLKPVSYFNLSLKLDKAITLLSRQRTFSFISEGRTIVLSEDDVYYIEGNNQYVLIHTQKENYKVHQSLKGIEGQFGAAFCRCHNSFLVNLNYVYSIEGNDAIIGENRLPISRDRKKPFLESLNRYIGGF